MSKQTQTRKENHERLVRALQFYREHPPAIATRPAIVAIARRFAVHPKTLETAIDMIARGESE